MKKWTYFILALILVTLQACHTSSFKSGDYFVEGDSLAYSLYDPYIDEFGNEGVVAYVSFNDNGRDFIIVISSDEGYESWGPMGEAVYKNDISFDTIYDYYLLYYPAFGIMMMQSMKSMGIERFPAQQWCDKKNLGDPYPSSSSWRLPTYYELRLVFSSKDLNNALKQAGGTPLNNSYYYWTCLEDIENYLHFDNIITDFDRENRAIILNPHGNAYIDKDKWIKKNKYHVRAIKYIYYKN